MTSLAVLAWETRPSFLSMPKNSSVRVVWELVTGPPEDRKDAIDGFQGLGLGVGEVGGEVMDDSIVGAEDLSEVRDGAEGGVILVVMLDKGGWYGGAWPCRRCTSTASPIPYQISNDHININSVRNN